MRTGSPDEPPAAELVVAGRGRFLVPGLIDLHVHLNLSRLGGEPWPTLELLLANGVGTTVLDVDSDQVDLLRKLGLKVFYGDASRLDLLRAAGADKAKIFVLAIADLETSVRVAEVVAKNFPHLKIIARARNRRHAHVLMDIGVRHIVRETLHSSLVMGEQVLTNLGDSPESADKVIRQFLDYDDKLLLEQYAVHDSEEKLIQTARDRNEELERLLREDLEH